MGDQETFKAAVWYNGKIVNQDGNNPRYVGGIVKFINVDPNTEVNGFLCTVRDIFGIPEAVPITMKYHIFFSSEISKLLDVTPYESLNSMLQPGLMLHPFYVEENVAENGTDTNSNVPRSLNLMLQPGLMLHPFYVEENVAENGTDTNSNVPRCKRSARTSNAIQSPPTGVEIPVKPSARVSVDGSLNHDQAPVLNPIPPRLSARNSNKRSATDRDDPVDAVTVGDRVGRTSSTSNSQIRIIIKSLCGLEKPLNVDRTETVMGLKKRILKIEGTAVEEQVLMYVGKRLSAGTLADYGIAEGSVVDILQCMKGC